MEGTPHHRGRGSTAALIVAKSPETIVQLFATPAPWVGGIDSALDNREDNLELSDATCTVIDTVRYDDRFPWPATADGGGGSLERLCASVDA